MPLSYHLSFPFVLLAATVVATPAAQLASNASHLLLPPRQHRLLQACPGTGDCTTCIAVANCVWCADAGYCSSSGTCVSGGPAKTCPSAPSASSVAWLHAGALGTFGVGVAATTALAVFTFSSSVKTSGALVWLPPTRKQRADVRLLFLGSSALWLGASLAAASPLLPWLVAATRSASDLGFTAFTYYECSTLSSPSRNSRLCVTIPSVSFVDHRGHSWLLPRLGFFSPQRSSCRSPRIACSGSRPSASPPFSRGARQCPSQPHNCLPGLGCLF